MKKSVLLLFSLFLTFSANAQDYASLDFSAKVIHSFTQGDNAGFNRSAISLVKCAIATFGLADVVKKVEAVNDGYIITLRNGDIVGLSAGELAYAKSQCGFKLMSEEKIFDKSIFLYAVLAKRMVNNPDPAFASCRDFKSSLSFLHARNKPVNVISLVPLLGFNYIEVKPYSEICYVHQTAREAVFACYEDFDDEGSKRSLNAIHQSKLISPKGKKEDGRLNIILANFISEVNAYDDYLHDNIKSLSLKQVQRGL